MGFMPNCAYHCGACGLHFRSLEAFDMHRQGDFAEPPRTEEGRHCAHPFDMDGRLVAITEDGVCRMYAEHERGVTVWSTARSRDRAPAGHWRQPPDPAL
jgi:hypothetical protein